MDREAWWATVHGVSKESDGEQSQLQLERSVWVAGDLGAAILEKAAVRRAGILDP